MSETPVGFQFTKRSRNLLSVCWSKPISIHFKTYWNRLNYEMQNAETLKTLNFEELPGDSPPTHAHRRHCAYNLPFGPNYAPVK